VLVVEAHQAMGLDLVRPFRSTCFVGLPLFSPAIPPSKYATRSDIRATDDSGCMSLNAGVSPDLR